MNEGNIKIFPRSKAYGENLERIKWDTAKDTQDIAEPAHDILIPGFKQLAENALVHILMGACEDTTPVEAIGILQLARQIFDDTFGEKIRDLREERHEDS